MKKVLNENEQKLVDLILLNRSEFQNAVLKRQGTSSGNKALHQRILTTIRKEDKTDFIEALFDPFYFHKPLYGVVMVLKLPIQERIHMVEAYEKAAFIK